MTDTPQTPPGSLDDVTVMLRKQLAACHGMIEECFSRAAQPRVYSYGDALKLGARLIQSATSLALALKRLEGQRQDIVVTRASA